MAPPSLSFTQSRVPVGKFFLLSLMSIALLALDRRFEAVQQVRNIAATATFPLQWLATQPVAFYHYSRDLAQSQTALEAQNRRLSADNIRLQAEANQNTALQKDVNELKGILGLKQETFSGSVAAAVVSSGRDPSSNLLVIDKGSESGIRQGDAVIDHGGLIGQITQVRPLSADIRLISAGEMIVPVVVARTGVRNLMFGDGNNLSLRYFPLDADLQKGDLLLTSGIDSVYPPGIPVAKVSELQKATGATFYRSKLEPSGNLHASKYLLVLKQKTDLPALDASSKSSKPSSTGTAHHD